MCSCVYNSIRDARFPNFAVYVRNYDNFAPLSYNRSRTTVSGGNTPMATADNRLLFRVTFRRENARLFKVVNGRRWAVSLYLFHFRRFTETFPTNYRLFSNRATKRRENLAEAYYIWCRFFGYIPFASYTKRDDRLP